VEHCEIVLGTLFISGGDPAELFKAVEQALHAIAGPITLSVKAATAVLIGFGGDHRPDATGHHNRTSETAPRLKQGSSGSSVPLVSRGCLSLSDRPVGCFCG
jgi:hypothetical protein